MRHLRQVAINFLVPRRTSGTDSSNGKEGLTGAGASNNHANANGVIGKRDTPQDVVAMLKTVDAPERIGDGVSVANLPKKRSEKSEFDVYKRSTTDFASLVTPHGVSGVGLGAGFGAKQDKRLGFLRPRQQPIQAHSMSSEMVPKYDENGLPIDATLTRDQLMKKRMEYIKSFEGMSVSRDEHFLLADLDFDRDSILFGNTREEFERNVTRLKNVITTYNKWERTDNFYYYSTWVLRLLTLYMVMECIQQYYELYIFSQNYELFAEVLEGEIGTLQEAREKDIERTVEELKRNKPDFVPVVTAITTEKERVQRKRSAESSDQKQQQAHPMDTTGEASYMAQKLREEQRHEMERLQNNVTKGTGIGGVVRALVDKVRRLRGGASTTLRDEDYVLYSYAASPTSVETLKNIRRALLPRSEDYTQIVREEMLRYKLKREEKPLFPQ